MTRPDLQPYGHAQPQAPEIPRIRTWLPRYVLITLVVLWVIYAGLLGTSHDQLDGDITYPAFVLGPAAALAAICACYLCIPRPRHWAYGAQVLLALLVAAWFVVMQAYVRPAPPPPSETNEGR